jgi:hypothetical protein
MADHEGERAGELERREPQAAEPAARVPWEGHVGHELDEVVEGRTPIRTADRRTLLQQPKEPSLD